MDQILNNSIKLILDIFEQKRSIRGKMLKGEPQSNNLKLILDILE